MKSPDNSKRKKIKSKDGNNHLADFLLGVVSDATSADCGEWKQGVRLLSYGLLKPMAAERVKAHLKGCAACRIFLLDCMNAQNMFIDSLKSDNPAAADRLSNGKDAMVKIFPSSKTMKNYQPPSSPYEKRENLDEIKKEIKNEKE